MKRESERDRERERERERESVREMREIPFSVPGSTI